MNYRMIKFVFRTLTPTMLTMIRRILNCQVVDKILYVDGKRDLNTMDALVDRGVIHTEPAKDGFNIVLCQDFVEFLSSRTTEVFDENL